MTTSKGFQPDFIDAAMPVRFPKLNAVQKQDMVTTSTEASGELKYPHFSLFLSKSRRFPFFTATNIDGKLFKKIPRKTIFPGGTDLWSVDDRVTNFQWGPHLYSAEKSDFQRGHMTKREDPQWGTTEAIALEAAKATFHFTNCVPQVEELNTKEWGKLETFILEKTSVPDKLKVCVLTGPVLADDDPVFVTKVDEQDVRLPTLFWKIVYYTSDGNKLSRAGFLMGQENSLVNRGIIHQAARRTVLREAIHQDIFQNFEDKAIYQVNIDNIQNLSGLDFAPAEEAYKDKRLLKLIIKKVQVPLAERARPSVIEETGEAVSFSNIIL